MVEAMDRSGQVPRLFPWPRTRPSCRSGGAVFLSWQPPLAISASIRVSRVTDLGMAVHTALHGAHCSRCFTSG
jgi:hypothetical protein